MLKRLLFSLLTVFLCTMLTFFIIRAAPGNPVKAMASSIMMYEGLDEETAYARAKSMLNYDPDQNIFSAFGSYFYNLVQGNLGVSMVYRQPVINIIFDTLPWTLLILVLALSFSAGIGILAGLRIAWARKRWMTTGLNLYSSIFGAIPEYIVAYLLVSFLAGQLHIFPMKGAWDGQLVKPGWDLAFIVNVLYFACLPVLTYVITQLSGWVLGTRAQATNVLGSDYTTYAMARGLSAKRIAKTYVGRNAILPMVTNIVLSFGFMFGGVGLVEGVFNYPGLGAFFVGAIGTRDYPLMQGMFLMTTLSVVLFSYLAEILYRIIDPRIRSIKL
jgi:peptide/nickel transport system permease protein